MRWMDRFRMAMISLFWRRRATERLDAEMRFHLEQEIAERVKAGAAADEARSAAMREFGNPAVLRDEARRSWSWGWLETIARDVRFGTRIADAIERLFDYDDWGDGSLHRGDDLSVYDCAISVAEAAAVS